MFTCFDTLHCSLAENTVKTVVVAAAHDKHTLEAIYHAGKELPMKHILIGNREKIIQISAELGHAPGADAIVDAGDDADCARKAISIIHDGGGDVLMKGLLETGTLLRAVLDKDSGIRSYGTMSHLAILDVPGYHKLIGVTDGGIIPTPTLQQKADIVRSTAGFYRSMGFEQLKIAALCASETVSEKIQETVDAEILQTMCEDGELGECLLEGPLSFDIAVSRETAELKGHPSKISGETDVLLVPNITAGNAFGKGLMYWGGAKMAGCVLGAKVPIIVVSRGASADEKFCSIMLCVAAGSCGNEVENGN